MISILLLSSSANLQHLILWLYCRPALYLRYYCSIAILQAFLRQPKTFWRHQFPLTCSKGQRDLWFFMSLKPIPHPVLMEIVVELYLRGFEARALCSGLEEEKGKMDVKMIQVSPLWGWGQPRKLYSLLWLCNVCAQVSDSRYYYYIHFCPLMVSVLVSDIIFSFC